MSDDSKITTLHQVDDPIVLNSNFKIDTHDRRYIDNQIIGTQAHVVNNLISGFTGTWGVVDGGSSPIAVGNCIVVKGNFITKAVNPDLTNAGTVFGVALIAASAGEDINYAIGGAIPANVTGLGNGLAQPVICDPTTAVITRVSSVGPTDFPVGVSTTTGVVNFNISKSGSGGGGGGGSGGGYALINIASDANFAISSSQWTKSVIRITDTGNLLTQSRVVTIPSSPGDTRIIHNDTAKSLTFTTGSGANFVIGAGFSSSIDAKNTDVAGIRNGAEFNVLDFGATGDGVTDDTVAILAAVAQANKFGNPIFFPTGIYFFTKPIRITSNGVIVKGQGKTLSILRPAFQGPCIIMGAPLTDIPPVLANGPFGGNAYNLGQGRNYSIDLRMAACGEVNNIGAFTCEAVVELTSDLSVGQTAIVASSCGQDNTVGNIFATAFILGFTNSGSGPTNQAFCALTINGLKLQITSSSNTTSGSYHHIAVDWDGSTLRLLVDGNVASSFSTPGSQKLTQYPYEGVNLGSAIGLNTNVLYPVSTKLRIGPTRGRLASIYSASIGGGSTYTPPSAPFPNGDPNDLWVINWDQTILGDVNKGFSQSSRPVFFPSIGQDPTVSHVLELTAIKDLSIVGDAPGISGQGGALIQQCLHWSMQRVDSVVTWFLFVATGAFESYFKDCNHNGSHAYPGIINDTTSGDIFDNVQSENCSYPFVLVQGQTMQNCTVGQWGVGAAGIMTNQGFIDLDNIFFDAETQNQPSRGCLLASQCTMGIRGGDWNMGGLMDQPIITSDASDINIDCSLIGSSFGVSNASTIVDILSPAPNQIKFHGILAGFKVPLISSSVGANVGKIVYESGIAGDPIGTSQRNLAIISQYQGDVVTTTSDSAVIADCFIPIDPHSSVNIDAVVQGRADNDTDHGVWKIAEQWKRGRLGTSPVLVSAWSTSPDTNGSNSGTPPSGWGSSLVGTSTGVNTTVQGVSATKISWIGDIVVNRSRTLAPSWTPIELSPIAWFRGDVGSVSSWTDQSGNGNNAPVGGTSPTTTTLGGQSAFDFAGGGSFKNTSTNLLSASQSNTVLCVGQALDGTGGVIFAIRTSGAGVDLEDLIFTSGGFSYISTGGSEVAYLFSQLIAYESQSPFLAEWSQYEINSNVRNVRFDMNRRYRQVVNFVGPESGGTGFYIGNNASGRAWNGKIAELVILSRIITPEERFLWSQYVNTRYGI